ncbi:hypothetical protein ACINLE_14315 [Bacillus sp. z60-18]|uniref:hypothetical protein n=1 Tax=unclassified Bacillus (in: firmicutes) TaxID=185979 RepID=UPI00240A2A50|nr:hypothetical protein [Bacillus sp. HSf4]WFA05541.1 hypothetical protein P3X63_01365 [Bacillus sp. HSf4]
MSDYPLKHDHVGSVVCKVETYRFRFRGVPAAEIEIANVPGENASFSFQIKRNEQFWPDLPFHLSNQLSAGAAELEQIGFGRMWYESKTEALQAATDAIEHILKKHKEVDKLEFSKVSKQ